MNLLLDTHIFLWLNQEIENIPPNIFALSSCSHALRGNTVLGVPRRISHRSVWERVKFY